jgi:hypothetical protein
MSKRMALALKGFRAGEIGFTRFAAETREDWDKLAGKWFTVFSRKGIPCGITEDDVRQEMLLAAWRAVQSYDPDHPGAKALEVHVVWNACNRATKWLNRQRKARDRRSPSRHPVTMGMLGIDRDGELSDAEVVDLFASQPAEQEQRADHARLLLAVVGVADTQLGRDATRFWVEAGGDLVEAGVDLFLDDAMRADHGIRTPRQGVRAVERAVKQVEQALSAGGASS